MNISMDWRFKMKIKIFPGIYINIGRSDISVNESVKETNVKFGPNESYVNTGIPGTGLFRQNIMNTDAALSAYNASKEKGIPFDPKVTLAGYQYPTVDLLRSSVPDKPIIDMDENYANKKRLIELLNSFGIYVRDVKTTIGARISLYEITLTPGCKASRLTGLEDDIALALFSYNVHIIVPMPGKGTVGIEVPRSTSYIVSVHSVFDSQCFKETKMDLPCAIGKTITNKVFIFDLTKSPHVLIAGSTGQGKSVIINVMIASLLYKKHPAEMKLVLMDSSGLEYGPYSRIENHFLASFSGEQTIISNSNSAVNILDSLCKEMEKRFELLRKTQSINIKDFNNKLTHHKISPIDGHMYLPYIVVVIDEYGEFIEERGKDFEQPLTRLAKYSGIVGIHLVISTRRFDHDTITSSIKAYFPTRIAFRVPERSFSKIILDCYGAEGLLDDGDMLFRSGKSIDCVRVQGAYIDTYGLDSIINSISHQKCFSQPFMLPNSINNGFNDSLDFYSSSLDPLFEEVARAVILNQQCNTSMIQRRFSIGYNRACRLMDQLEKTGVVGSGQGSRPREVMIADEISLDDLLSELRKQGAY